MGDVIVTENTWIPLRDGCRLAARLWLPENSHDAPVAAILEYIPYRKRDATRARDEPMHGYFAANGFAAIRVDLRGAGESDGHLADEYLPLEQDDALEVIEWIAAQSWCNGAVGMIGKSWGGFNALQVAARRPAALRAIITVCSTDNRFTDDIHFMGGCLLNDNLWWGSIMLAYQSRPPDPELVGEGWRDLWLERLANLPFFPALWLAHQRYDEYWKHGSIEQDYAAIECPVLAVGGWADSYTNAIPRLLENLRVPCAGIIGPWAHVYPHDGTPAPAIGFLQEAVRWWDRWLSKKPAIGDDEPMLRAYIEDETSPTTTVSQSPGRWVGESTWPSPTTEPQVWYLNAGGELSPQRGESCSMTFRSPQSHGKAAGEWMATGCPGERPGDQRVDDAFALVFDSSPLADDVEILGAPVISLSVASDSPVAQLCVRLCDVSPDGQSRRVTWQVLNLTHREGHESPSELPVDETFEVTLALNVCGHLFRKGHRIRVAMATANWPIVWPAPYAAALTLDCGKCELRLPRRSVQSELPVQFDPPEQAAAAQVTVVDGGSVRRITSRDEINGMTTYVTEGVGGVFGEGVLRFDDIDVTLSHSLKRELSIHDDDPLSARAVVTQTYAQGREGWQILIETQAQLHSDRENFYLEATLQAFENGALATSRDWQQVIKRDLC